MGADTQVWSKGIDLRSIAYASWVQIPLRAKYISAWRNWIARKTSNLEVVGSNPIVDSFLFFYIPFFL
jgi:hypothetical protein